MSQLSKTLSERVEHAVAQLRSAVAEFKNVCYANSLGAESVVLTDLIWGQGTDIEIFSVDTGRLYPETYDLIERIQKRYGRKLRMYYPEAVSLENWVSDHGVNGFRAGLAQRQGCCAVRKVEPFRRAVAGRGAWVTGIRHAQSAGRAKAAAVAWDVKYCLQKISPLLDWSEDDVWEYIRKKRLPYNALHDSGFPSIGCAPCTRAVQPGEDQRAGRWWWERAESRECGLHPREPEYAI
jgi:phosphoadenosine phosphosulfate reductase